MAGNENIDVKEQKEQEKTCPLCTLTPILMGIGTAHAACSAVDNPEQKAGCMKWVEAIKPEEIKQVDDIFDGMLKNAGFEALDRSVRLFNLEAQKAIIRNIGKKLRNREEVSKMEMDSYKSAIQAQAQKI